MWNKVVYFQAKFCVMWMKQIRCMVFVCIFSFVSIIRLFIFVNFTPVNGWRNGLWNNINTRRYLDSLHFDRARERFLQLEEMNSLIHAIFQLRMQWAAAYGKHLQIMKCAWYEAREQHLPSSTTWMVSLLTTAIATDPWKSLNLTVTISGLRTWKWPQSMGPVRAPGP